MDREFDLVIFGFTGFTGYFVLRELLISIKENPSELKNIKWAIAGRNVSKLEEGLKKLKEECKELDVDGVVKIQADASDFDSLYQMAKRTKLVINTVGPYRFFGRPVVEACVNAGTHHIDISGENAYIEQSVLDFNKTASENGSLIISTCGWDSIPCDMGVAFLKKKFGGTLNSVETYMSTIEGPQGYKVNFGTFQSIIYIIGFGEWELRAIRRRMYSEIFTKKPPVSKKKLSKRWIPFQTDDVPGWNIIFPGSDESVVKRTQHHNYEDHSERPTQIETYFNLPNFLTMAGLLFLVSIFGFLSFFSWGRSLLERYPELLTFGRFTKSGPTRQQIETTKFRLTLVGKGWKKTVDDPTVEPEGEPNKKVIAYVDGRDPGYMATSTCLVQAGLTILLEREKMKAGVLTPATAFRDTKLFERLQKRGLKFTIKE